MSHCVYQFNEIDGIAKSRCGEGNRVCCPVTTPASDAQSLFEEGKTTATLHAAFFGSKPIVQSLGRDGLIGLEATRELARKSTLGENAHRPFQLHIRRFNLDSLQGRDGLQRFNIQDTVIADACPKIPPCPSTKYRSPDGLCNNLKNREWGKSLTAYERFMPPDYADGESTHENIKELSRGAIEQN
ncbi:hypothetical protein HPB48_018710 [Haemaphysalis longicornis]|uniref:Peroxidase n=1 Tax=Haemaphysalis longicornis TaxID=44386 RepID=A0A9J6FZ78_HAELO|nr:hypothetical protein HPB48_018710 [Haemaphysalis longicornis]